jgi:hypothetical protein
VRATLRAAGFRVHDHLPGYAPVGFVAIGETCLVMGLDAGTSYPAVWHMFSRRGPAVAIAAGHTQDELSTAIDRLLILLGQAAA